MDTIQDYYSERFTNLHNPFQTKAKRVLCVCSAGLLRSPTVAWVLSNPPYSYNTRSCGTEEYALVRIDQALVEWADTVLFVNRDNFRRARFVNLENKHVAIMSIPDVFEWKHPRLIEMLNEQLPKHFDLKQEAPLAQG